MIDFFVPQNPQGKQSPRAVQIGGFARVVKDPKTRKYEGMIAVLAAQAMAGRAPIAEPVAVRLEVWMPVPASWSHRRAAQAIAGSILPTVKPDCSNVLKAVEDGCNGVVFVDDKQIADVVVSKRYGEMPGVRVFVEPLSAQASHVAALPSPQAALPIEDADDPWSSDQG